MGLYSSAEKPSSCRQQGVLSSVRQYDLDGNENPVYESISDIENQRETVVSHDGQFRFEFTAKQLSLFPPSTRKCLKGKLTMKRCEVISGTLRKTSYYRARCGSWRCPDCRRKVASVDFARIKQALEGCDPEELSYLVVTLDQSSLRYEEEGFNAKTSYLYMTKQVTYLMKLLRLRYGNVEYVASIEQHQSGYCHINIIVKSKGLAEDISSSGTNDGVNVASLRDLFERANLGRFSAQRIRSVGQIAGYVVKIAFEKKLVGETTKTSQLPMNAPFGTRRLRSSKGFLPKKLKPQKQDGVTWEWMSGVSAHEITEAQKAWDKHFAEWGLDSPQEQRDEEAKPVVECVAPADRQSEGSTTKTGDVQSAAAPCHYLNKSESSDASRESHGPESTVPIGVENQDYWKRYRRLQRRGLRIVRSCDNLRGGGIKNYGTKA